MTGCDARVSRRREHPPRIGWINRERMDIAVDATGD
jgi:hypothetical protein